MLGAEERFIWGHQNIGAICHRMEVSPPAPPTASLAHYVANGRAVRPEVIPDAATIEVSQDGTEVITLDSLERAIHRYQAMHERPHTAVGACSSNAGVGHGPTRRDHTAETVPHQIHLGAWITSQEGMDLVFER